MANNITEEFRNGLSQGQLLLQKCLDCGKLNMYPRHACPHCPIAFGVKDSLTRHIKVVHEKL